jgi:hypothetical protein
VLKDDTPASAAPRPTSGVPKGAGALRSDVNGRRRRVRRLVLILAGCLVIVVAAVIVDGYLQALSYGRELRGLFPRIEQARSDVLHGESRIPQAVGDVQRVVADVRHARFTFGLTGMLPFLGRPVDAVRLGADAADQGGQALAIVQGIVDDLTGTGSSGKRLMSNGQINLPLLQTFAPRVGDVIRHLQAGSADIRAIPHIPFVGQLDGMKAEALTGLRDALASARRADSAARLIPSLFGASGQRTYFVALQNNADLRATGGALLAWGIIRIDATGHLRLASGGPIKTLDTRHYIRVDTSPGIEWYHEITDRPYILNNGFNYTPDFPSVAEAWAEAVRHLRHTPIQGVIAIDPVGVQALMTGQPPIVLPSSHRVLHAADIPRFTEHDQYTLSSAEQHELPSQLIRAAFDGLSRSERLPETVNALSKAISDKRIQLWSNDPEAMRLLTGMGWDNAIHSGPGDYLYLTDNKRNANKVDFFSHTSIVDNVRIDAQGTAHNTVTVTLTNDTPPGENGYIVGPWNPYALNVAMMTLYVPREARHVVVTPAAPVRFHTLPRTLVTNVEAGRLALTKVVLAWPGHPATLTYSYETPGVVTDTQDGKRYELAIQHQPLINPAHLEVNVTLPANAHVTDGAGWVVHGTRATFSGDLDQDLSTAIGYDLAGSQGAAGGTGTVPASAAAGDAVTDPKSTT